MRLAVDDSKSACKFNCKFGCKLVEVEKILTIVKTLKLDIIGFSFHVGSSCSSADNYYYAISDCKTATDIAKKMDITITTIDIGGGFPGVNKLISFEDIAVRVNDGIRDFFLDDVRDKKIQFISEPGRYFAQTSHILVLNVIGKKIIYDTSIKNINTIFKTDEVKENTNENDGINDKKIIYYLNDGVYGSFNCIFFDHNNPIILPFNERKEKLYKTTIFGPTCDSIDLISENVLLPELAIGEWVYVEDFGAYTAASSSSFNGFKTNICNYIFKS